MNVPEIATALSAAHNGLKMLGGLIKGANEANVQNILIDLNNVILGLQGQIYGIQGKFDELVEEKEAIQKTLREYQRWEAEAARYQLITLAEGIFVYALAEDQAGGQPPHFICPNCYQQRKKSILHHPRAGTSNFVCDVCKFNARPVKATQPRYGVATRANWNIRP